MDNTTYEFRYLKDNHEIDIDTLVDTQKEFNTILTEIQSNHFPDTKLKIKIQAFKQGSFIIEHSIEILSTVGTTGLALWKYKEIGAKVISVFKDLLEIRKLLKGEKPTDVNQKTITTTTTNTDNSSNTTTTVVNITVNNLTINVSPEAWKEHQTNKIINKSIEKTIQALEQDTEINGFELNKIEIPEDGEKITTKILTVERDEFEELKIPNPYFDFKPEEKTEDVDKVVLNVKTIDYYPDNKSKYQFFFRDKVINAKITAPEFLETLNKGEKFGQGDILIVKLRILKKLNTITEVYENKNYEIVSVHEHKKSDVRGIQGDIFQ